jgi:hypothetical protein
MRARRTGSSSALRQSWQVSRGAAAVSGEAGKADGPAGVPGRAISVVGRESPRAISFR